MKLGAFQISGINRAIHIFCITVYTSTYYEYTGLYLLYYLLPTHYHIQRGLELFLALAYRPCAAPASLRSS